MNVKIQSRNIEISKTLDHLIQRKSAKTRQVLPSFRPHDLDLHVTLEKLSTGRQYHTTLVLALPQTAIRVETIEENDATSVVRAFDELTRRIKRFKSQLSRERFWQRETAPATPAVKPTHPAVLEEFINQNLEKVENYIRRELYHRAVEDNLPPGVLQPQALTDEVFLQVSSQAGRKPENLSVEQWMFQIARNVIDRGIEQIEETREDAHIEEAGVTESDKWDDEILNFYQPDESLRVEDLLKDVKSTTPEELLEREETEEQIQKAIATLPKPVRESFVLFALEGFNSDEVAMITGKRPEEVLAEVKQARDHLRGVIARIR